MKPTTATFRAIRSGFPSRPLGGYIDAMAMALAIFGVVFAALVVWLTVRIVNRREWWAMQLAAILGSWALAIAYGVVLLWLAAWGAI